MAYANGNVEEPRALLTENQKVELVAEVEDAGKAKVEMEVDEVEGKAEAAAPAAKVRQGRKDT